MISCLIKIKNLSSNIVERQPPIDQTEQYREIKKFTTLSHIEREKRSLYIGPFHI